jgi:putative ABC transport system permease protein
MTMVLHIVLGLLLLLIPAGALYLFDRSLLRTFGIAVGRMVVQLLVLCLIVWALVKYDKIWLSLLWLVVLAVVSGVLALRRMNLPIVRFLLPVSAGLLVSALLVGSYLLWACLPAENGFGARWFVPVMALLTGHTMTSLIRGLSTYQSALKADRQQYEFLRGNGTDHLHAVLPFVRRALQQIFAPTAANLAAMGLYAMPLLLCGIFIAGVAPINAFVVTLQLIFGCLAASVIALGVTLWLADRQLFA